MLELTLTLAPGESEDSLLKECRKKLRAPVKYFRILKKSLDARGRGEVKWVYRVACSDRPFTPPEQHFAKVKGSPRVVIAGAGPAGLFCALRLIDYGILPVVIERGKAVEERTADVRDFLRTGKLDPSSNVQFGEGGAGTFSDGKLVTRTKDPLCRDVLSYFVKFGAPEEVAYLGKPHVGSDNLPRIVSNIRNYIRAQGGEVRFSSKLTDFFVRDGKLCGVAVNGGREDADALVLAVGHSARDTFELLLGRGLSLEQKEFAAGVRVEHLQRDISAAQYGDLHTLLPPADYALVSHAAERSAFTFCMCPGGVVIPSCSEEGGVVVNGMSDFRRGEKNANAALVAQVRKEDFGSDHPLAGVAFQRRMEEAAYRAGGGGYAAPVQLLGDFLAGKESTCFGKVLPSYGRGTTFAPVDSYLPASLSDTLRAAIPDLDSRLHGFASYDAVLTGVESRTSSPVRVIRGEDLQAPVEGIYPCGEGCGYAGGIMSAAVDGMRVARAIALKYGI